MADKLETDPLDDLEIAVRPSRWLVPGPFGHAWRCVVLAGSRQLSELTQFKRKRSFRTRCQSKSDVCLESNRRRLTMRPCFDTYAGRARPDLHFPLPLPGVWSLSFVLIFGAARRGSTSRFYYEEDRVEKTVEYLRSTMVLQSTTHQSVWQCAMPRIPAVMVHSHPVCFAGVAQGKQRRFVA